jgi:hypothetical protein
LPSLFIGLGWWANSTEPWELVVTITSSGSSCGCYHHQIWWLSLEVVGRGVEGQMGTNFIFCFNFFLGHSSAATSRSIEFRVFWESSSHYSWKNARGTSILPHLSILYDVAMQQVLPHHPPIFFCQAKEGG